MNLAGAPRRRTRAVGVVLAGLLVLTACTSTEDAGAPSGGSPAGAPQVDVEVDTPELRKAKAAAGIEPCPEADASDAVENGLPEITLPCLGGGGEVDLSTLRGPMVINVWASWCKPCEEELPYYQRLHEQAGDRLRVLGVDYQDTRPAAALELARVAGVTYPSLADPDAQTRVPWRVRGLPGIVFVDESGEVVGIEYVVVRSYEQLAGLVQDRLGLDVGAAG